MVTSGIVSAFRHYRVTRHETTPHGLFRMAARPSDLPAAALNRSAAPFCSVRSRMLTDQTLHRPRASGTDPLSDGSGLSRESQERGGNAGRRA